MDSSPLVDALPIERRLALSYAPGRARAATLGLFALDATLGNLVRSAREPLLGQMRLAWWREELAKPAAARAQGEPVLALLGQVPDFGQSLASLVDGWEELLGEAPIGQQSLAQFASARGQACAALADAVGAASHRDAARHCGDEWARAELAMRLSNPHEHASARALASQASWRPIALPRSLRPLKVLHTLAIRSKGEAPLLGRRRDMIAAIRLGLLGV